MLRFLSVILLTLTSTLLSAQSLTLSGKVTDNKNKPLAAANILLFSVTDSSLIRSTYSDDNGDYMLENLNAGSYSLKVLLQGHEEYNSTINLTSNNILPTIALTEKNKNLKEVEITALKPLIEIKNDKIIVNVDNSAINAGSNVLEVLGRSPGVTVDQNEQIKLKGRPGVTIMIDGKIIPLSSTEIANILKGMQSNMVDKIELISNPSAKYDAAGTAGIINIKTKKDKRMGMNGNANMAYAQGVYPKAATGFNLNYRNKKISAYAGYSFALRKGLMNMPLHRTFYQDNIPTLTYDQLYNTVHIQKAHVANAGIDYTISPKTTIGFAGTGSSNNYDPDGLYISKVLDGNGNLQSTFRTRNKTEYNWNNYTTNLNLRHTFDSLGTSLSIDADYGRYWNIAEMNINNSYYFPDGSTSLPPFLLHGDMQSITQIRSAKADFSTPLSQKINFEAGAKASYVTANTKNIFNDRSNGSDIYDSTRSNHFLYEEQINAAYINSSAEFGKWSFQAGLRTEQSNIKGKQLTYAQQFEQHYIQLFPSLATQYQLHKNHNLSISLSRRIQRPDYEKLNPFKYFLDPTEYDEGNPNLKPALAYSTDLTHTFKQKFITSFTYAHTDQVITEVVKQDEYNDKVTSQLYVNSGTVSYYALSTYYPFTITKWWTTVCNVNGYYMYYKGSYKNTLLDRKGFSYDINSTNSFKLAKGFSGELTFVYNAPVIYAFMKQQANWSLNMGVSKKLLHDKMSLRLNASDIFWKSIIRGTSTYTNYTQSFETKGDSRRVTLSLVYNFGRSTVAPVRKRSSGAEDEKQRANKG
jgi:hypothetical protein